MRAESIPHWEHAFRGDATAIEALRLRLASQRERGRRMTVTQSVARPRRPSILDPEWTALRVGGLLAILVILAALYWALALSGAV